MKGITILSARLICSGETHSDFDSDYCLNGEVHITVSDWDIYVSGSCNGSCKKTIPYDALLKSVVQEANESHLLSLLHVDQSALELLNRNLDARLFRIDNPDGGPDTRVYHVGDFHVTVRVGYCDYPERHISDQTVSVTTSLCNQYDCKERPLRMSKRGLKHLRWYLKKRGVTIPEHALREEHW